MDVTSAMQIDQPSRRDDAKDVNDKKTNGVDQAGTGADNESAYARLQAKREANEKAYALNAQMSKGSVARRSGANMSAPHMGQAAQAEQSANVSGTSQSPQPGLPAEHGGQTLESRTPAQNERLAGESWGFHRGVALRLDRLPHREFRGDRLCPWHPRARPVRAAAGLHGHIDIGARAGFLATCLSQSTTNDSTSVGAGGNPHFSAGEDAVYWQRRLRGLLFGQLSDHS